jgi:hypothetical protein
MSEMVDRVAAAMWNSPNRDPFEQISEAMQFLYRQDAARAIRAMREPTAGMLNASPIIGTGLDGEGNWTTNTKPSEAVWAAMIDKALSE